MYESMYEVAERVRFELTDAFASTVFKTAPTDRALGALLAAGARQ